ncbi:hypothetical protein D9758_004411 [Tetrapyrgos nigripes]|uniref:Uncharacterized protein n=1 Tax=Tetrapyrgos nigripes TaxID=182062 RepID=A0A8H5GN32_9AGAR|nr:hypothetical protein D9758_004411 [Tetrapyrgos nigripes]
MSTPLPSPRSADSFKLESFSQVYIQQSESRPRSQRASYFRRESQIPALMDVEISALRSPAVQSASGLTSSPRKERGDNPFKSFYWSLSWIVGFKERYSLFLFFVCGGALLGFCLARAFNMNGRIRREQTPPGTIYASDFRWFDLAPYRVSYIMHIYTTIIGGILVGLQFLPTIRRNVIWIHRLNGNIAGAIVARRSLGGEINVQAAYYLLTIMLVFAMLMGLYNVKRNTRAHRRWMLRSVTYFSAVVLARVIGVIAGAIVTRIGAYYSCVNNVSDLSNNPFSVAVHASNKEGHLGTASTLRAVNGMALWLSTLILTLGVEIYLNRTESANFIREGNALEPKNHSTDPEDTVYY